jgi:hypothetical protein
VPVDNFYEWRKTAAVKLDLNLGHRRSVKWDLISAIWSKRAYLCA